MVLLEWIILTLAVTAVGCDQITKLHCYKCKDTILCRMGYGSISACDPGTICVEAYYIDSWENYIASYRGCATDCASYMLEIWRKASVLSPRKAFCRMCNRVICNTMSFQHVGRNMAWNTGSRHIPELIQLLTLMTFFTLLLLF